jgi:hypothetical protein
VVASDHVTVARKAMVSESSVIGGSNFSDDLFGCKLRFRLGREVIWRHDAKHRLATDPPNPRLGENGRAPVPVFSLVGDYRIFGDVGHHGIASENSSPQLSRRL